jgi:hypothetical protein
MFGKIYFQNSAYTMTHQHVDDVVQNCLALVVKIIVWHELYLISLPTIYLDQSATGAYGVFISTSRVPCTCAGNDRDKSSKYSTSRSKI